MIVDFISRSLIHQILKCICYIGDCNCVTHTFNFCGGKFCRVDTDNFTIHIQKCTTTVTRIDCCICLNQVCCIRIFILFYALIIEFTVLCTDNTGCYRLSVTKCVTDCNDLLTNLQIIRASDRSYCYLIHCIIRNIRKCYRNDCKVFVLIVTVYGCFISLTIDAGNRYGICSTYNMIVGCDQKIIIILSDNDTGTASLNFLLSGKSLTSAKSISSEIVLYILDRFCCNCYNRFHSFCSNIRNIKTSFCL